MPPDNGGFMVAAYIATAVVVVTYAIVLFLRARNLR